MEKPSRFALGATLLTEQGFGGLARLRFGQYGFDLSGAVTPFVLFIDGGCDDLRFGAAERVTASAFYYFTNPDKRVELGVRVGGLWHGLYGAGTSAGFAGEFALGRRFAINFGVGLQFYPEGKSRRDDEIRDHCGPGAEAQEPGILSIVQFYTGLNLLGYLY